MNSQNNNNLESFNNIHDKQTCFIIGAGPSLYHQNLDCLKDNISICVNSGYLAYPECDYFLSDDWATQYWNYFFNDLVSNKKTKVLLYEDKLKNCAHLFDKRTILFKHRTGYELTTPYSHLERINHIWESRTSVGSAVHVAYIMGCSKIILLGIDCCRVDNKRYFWDFWDEDKRPFYKKHARRRYRETQYKDRQTDDDLLEILNYWNIIAKMCKNKIEIYNASNISIVDAFPKIKLT